MHLTDTELLAVDKDSLSKNAYKHLDQCANCQTRLNNIAAFRDKLNEPPEQVNFRPNSDAILYAFNEQARQLEHSKLNRKVKNLQKGLIALAACLCLVIIVPVLKAPDSQQSMDSQLAELIEQNHQLQRSIEVIQPSGRLRNVARENLKIRLQRIDSEIQLSYLEDLPKSEKLKLWSARKALLVESIEHFNNSNQQFTKSI